MHLLGTMCTEAGPENCRWVRCIRPTSKAVPHAFEGSMVMTQLKSVMPLLPVKPAVGHKGDAEEDENDGRNEKEGEGPCEKEDDDASSTKFSSDEEDGRNVKKSTLSSSSSDKSDDSSESSDKAHEEEEEEEDEWDERRETLPMFDKEQEEGTKNNSTPSLPDEEKGEPHLSSSDTSHEAKEDWDSRREALLVSDNDEEEADRTKAAVPSALSDEEDADHRQEAAHSSSSSEDGEVEGNRQATVSSSSEEEEEEQEEGGRVADVSSGEQNECYTEEDQDKQVVEDDNRDLEGNNGKKELEEEGGKKEVQEEDDDGHENGEALASSAFDSEEEGQQSQDAMASPSCDDQEASERAEAAASGWPTEEERGQGACRKGAGQAEEASEVQERSTLLDHPGLESSAAAEHAEDVGSTADVCASGVQAERKTSVRREDSFMRQWLRGRGDGTDQACARRESIQEDVQKMQQLQMKLEEYECKLEELKEHAVDELMVYKRQMEEERRHMHQLLTEKKQLIAEKEAEKHHLKLDFHMKVHCHFCAHGLIAHTSYGPPPTPTHHLSLSKHVFPVGWYVCVLLQTSFPPQSLISPDASTGWTPCAPLTSQNSTAKRSPTTSHHAEEAGRSVGQGQSSPPKRGGGGGGWGRAQLTGTIICIGTNGARNKILSTVAERKMSLMHACPADVAGMIQCMVLPRGCVSNPAINRWHDSTLMDASNGMNDTKPKPPTAQGTNPSLSHPSVTRRATQSGRRSRQGALRKGRGSR